MEKMENSPGFLQKLAAALMTRQPNDALLGAGAAANAAQQMMGRPYQLHVQEAQAMGVQPMTPQEFAARNSGR